MHDKSYSPCSHLLVHSNYVYCMLIISCFFFNFSYFPLFTVIIWSFAGQSVTVLSFSSHLTEADPRVATPSWLLGSASLICA